MEDFVVLFDGIYLMGKGSKLYKFNCFCDEDWIEIVDMCYYNIINIFCLVVSLDMKIVIVVDQFVFEGSV